jgi:hypothetical protein
VRSVSSLVQFARSVRSIKGQSVGVISRPFTVATASDGVRTAQALLNSVRQLHRTSETTANENRESNMPDYDAVHDLHTHRPDPTTPDTPDTPDPGQPPEPGQPDTVPDPTREPVEPDTPPIGDPPPQPSQTPHTRPGAAPRGGVP